MGTCVLNMCFLGLGAILEASVDPRAPAATVSPRETTGWQLWSRAMGPQQLFPACSFLYESVSIILYPPASRALGLLNHHHSLLKNKFSLIAIPWEKRTNKRRLALSFFGMTWAFTSRVRLHHHSQSVTSPLRSPCLLQSPVLLESEWEFWNADLTVLFPVPHQAGEKSKFLNAV